MSRSVFLLLINRGKSFVYAPKLIHSLDNYLLSVYYVLSTLLETGGFSNNQNTQTLVFVEIPMWRVDKQSLTSV